MKKIIGVLTAALILLIAIPTAAALATVTADKKTAEPGDTLTITGQAAADENVVVKITDEAGNIVFFDAAKADASGNYTASFVVPSGMAAGKLTVTVGSGSDVAVTTVSVKSLPTPSSTPKPTTAPTSLPTSTPKPTAVPTLSPTSTPKPTAAPMSSPTSTPKPTAVPTSSPTSTSKPTTAPTSSPTTGGTPAASSEPTATNSEEANVPDTNDDAQTIVPIQGQEDEEAGTVTIEIYVSDLPEGTTAVKLPNGEVVKLDGSDTLRIEIKKSDIGDDGSFLLTAIDDEGTSLGGYEAKLEQFKTLDTSNAWDSIWSVFKWVLIAIGLLGVAGVAVYLLYKKRNRA